jgi:hypothetical protein
MQVLPIPTNADVADVSGADDFYCADEVFQGTTVIGTPYVLGGNFLRTEFVEFAVFDVLDIIWIGGLDV